MNIKNEATCCDNCFELIAKRSTEAAKFWLTLCDIKNEVGVFGLFQLPKKYIEILPVLEKMGFVVSTDVEDYLVVNVLGDQMDSEGTFFCCGKCR